MSEVHLIPRMQKLMLTGLLVLLLTVTLLPGQQVQADDPIRPTPTLVSPDGWTDPVGG
jgi:hypothetical protein